jgi:5-formyltetrahydrofolate cyclo-ligase
MDRRRDDSDEQLRHAAKREIRARLRAARGALPPRARQARSLAIQERVTRLPCFQNAAVVAGYVAMGNEADPAPILQRAVSLGRSIALPRVDPDTQALSLRSWSQGDPLVKSGWGVMEPPASAPAVPGEEVDLIIVPALAIDLRGYRIGYGKGCYDRLLAGLPGKTSIGIAFDFQLIEECPRTEGDVPVSLVVTDRRTIAEGREV